MRIRTIVSASAVVLALAAGGITVATYASGGPAPATKSGTTAAPDTTGAANSSGAPGSTATVTASTAPGSAVAGPTFAPDSTAVSDSVPSAAPESIPAGFVAQDNGAYVNPSSILAFRKADVTPAQVSQRFSSVDSKVTDPQGAGKLDDNDASSRLVTATVPADSSQAIMRSMNASGLYEAVQLDSLAFPQYTGTPNDPAFTTSNTTYGDTSYGLKNGPGGSNFNQVWPSLAAAALSANVPVAVLDTGFDLNNSDLINSNVKPGWNVVNNNANVSVCSNIDPVPPAHGTETASVIGAATNNSMGIAGAGFDATVKAYSIADSTCGLSAAYIIKGIEKAYQDNARVINISAGGPSDQNSSAICAAVQAASTPTTSKPGALVVASAGNVDATHANVPQYPASCPDALSVTATTSTGALASLANTTSSVDIAAAGEKVSVLMPNNYMGVADGTSFSAPYVAAAASLLMRLVPTATVSQVRDALVGNGNAIPGASYKRLDVRKAYEALAKTGPLWVSSYTASVASAANSSVGITVNSTGNWTAKSDQSWLTVPASGTSGSRMATFTAAANTATSPRTATVTFFGPNNTNAMVTVTQAAAAAPITVSSPLVTFTSAESSANVSVGASGNWTAKSDQSWLTVGTASGSSGTFSVKLSAKANTATSTRTATVTFTGPNNSSANVTVTQTGVTPTISLSSPSWSLSYPSGSTTVTVAATGNWSTTSNASSWLTLSQTSGAAGNFSVKLTAAANTEASTRTGAVIFTVQGGGSTTYTVTQAAAPASITVSPTYVPITNAANLINVTVNSTGNWTAKSDQGWLTVPTSGTSATRSVTLNAAANPQAIARSARVTFTGSNNTTTWVDVTQAAGEKPAITLSYTSWNVSSTGGTSSTTVASAGNWTATSSDPSWLAVGTSSGLAGTWGVNFTVYPNPGKTARSATVTFSTSGGSVTYTVTQAVSPVLPAIVGWSPSAAGESYTLTVSATESWTATSNQSWLTVSPASGSSGTRTVTLTAAKNTTGSSRIGQITFKGSSGSYTLSVNQS